MHSKKITLNNRKKTELAIKKAVQFWSRQYKNL